MVIGLYWYLLLPDLATRFNFPIAVNQPLFTDEQIHAGQAVYTKRSLSIYDPLVLGISNRLIWKCPTKRLLQHYNDHVSANHLDVGVGTGYFLDRCRFPVGGTLSPGRPRIVLLDLNSAALQYTAHRISRYQPESCCQNVLQPVPEFAQRFDSVGMNYLLHCLPGDLGSKSIAFDHLGNCMTPDAILFGSTLLTHGVHRGWPARRLMKLYNDRGIFSNSRDRLDQLQYELEQRFQDVTIDVAGCVALFSCRFRPTLSNQGAVDEDHGVVDHKLG